MASNSNNSNSNNNTTTNTTSTTTNNNNNYNTNNNHNSNTSTTRTTDNNTNSNTNNNIYNNNNSNNNSNNNNINNNSHNNSNNNNNNHSNILINRRRRHRQNIIDYMERMEMPMMLPLTMPTPMPMPMPMTMPMTMITPMRSHMERYARQPMLRARRQLGGWGAMGNEGQAGDVGNIGDNNHVVGIPTVAPANHMAHMGGGDAEIIFEAPLAPQHRGAGDGVQGEAAQPQPQRVIQPPRRETLEQRRERSVQQILRLCDFIQQQLATIAAQIDAYERKLAQHNAQSPSPPEPDGDVI
ncbi:putative uncharacterized protein DDB_G0286901 [Drosophila montana]|uniref:putative uncharacterized protein DDB_G0286901 n=1 Tax=Drosophila montana TaxID=40370 RepID=UPI00313E35C2